jgi:hypothetical protein
MDGFYLLRATKSQIAGISILLEPELPLVNPLRPVHTLEYLEKPTFCV